jgi:hypothetical protein
VGAAGGLQVAPGAPRPAAQLPGGGEGVEHLELVRRPGEPPLLELAGHGDQLLGDRGHVLAGRGAAPGVRARPAVGEDPPGEQEGLLALGSQVGERPEQLVVDRVELGLHVGLRPGRPDQRRVAARAEQQPDRPREDRLASAGLARDGVQPRRQLQVGRPDEDEVLDAQPAQHAVIVRRAPVGAHGRPGRVP